MTHDRYLKAVLTMIVLELLWLAAYGLPTPASAQAAATPVVITGIHLTTAEEGIMPVSIRGTVTVSPSGPVKVEADQPLPVESVPYTPSATPKE